MERIALKYVAVKYYHTSIVRAAGLAHIPLVVVDGTFVIA